MLKRRRPASVVDIGTGTGVLAMAAAKVLHRPVVCGDIDSDCGRGRAPGTRA